MKLDIRNFDRVGSTQDVCRALAQSGAAEGVTVVADAQTAGRGRMGQQWFSPPGQALYLSILLRPALAVGQANWITMIAALAVADGIAHVGVGLGHAPATIKWFNDVLLAGKKMGGILVETSMSDEKLDYAILGIGLNVNTDFVGAPTEVRAHATSLREHFYPGRAVNAEIDRQVVLSAVLAQFDQRYTELIATRRSPTPAYAAQLDTLGKWVRVQAGDETIEGLAEQVDDLGGLCVRTTQGVRVIYFGHVLSALSPQ